MHLTFKMYTVNLIMFPQPCPHLDVKYLKSILHLKHSLTCHTQSIVVFPRAKNEMLKIASKANTYGSSPD